MQKQLWMSHANVYRFFKTKAEIIDAVIERWLFGMEESIATLKFHYPSMIKQSLDEATEEQIYTVVKLLITSVAAGCDQVTWGRE